MTQWDPNIRNCGLCKGQIVLSKGNYYQEKASKRKRRFHVDHLRDFLLRKVLERLNNQGKTHEEILQLEEIGAIGKAVSELVIKDYELVPLSPNGAVPVSTYAFSKKKGYTDLDVLGSIEGDLDLGFVEIKDKNFDKANKHFDNAIKKYPSSDKPWFYKALILDMQNKLEEALNFYEKVIELNSKNSDAWINKGNMEAKSGNWFKANICYEKAYEINSEDFIPLYNKDIALSNINQKDAKSSQ